MIFEIPFNAKISIEQYTLRLKLTFKKNLITSGKNLVASGVIIFFGWLMLSDKSNVGYFFLSLGLFYLFNAIDYLRYYIRTKRKLKGIFHNLVSLREENKDVTIWGFENDVFKYKDMYYDYTIKWEAFKGYKIVKNNLFLLLAESIDQSFIISEEEIEAKKFVEVVAWVNERIKNLDPYRQ